MSTENTVITDDMEIFGIFKQLAKDKEKLWTWQKGLDKKGVRPVHYSLVRKVDIIKKTIEFVPNNTSGFRFSKEEDVFVYCTSRSIAFKVPMRELEKDFLTFSAPSRLNVLAGEFLKNVELVEKEDEEKNKHKRGAERKDAGGKVVTIKSVTNEHSPMGFFILYDISQGGLGFKVEDPAEFEIGETIQAIALDGNDFSSPLQGTVMSIRQMDESLESFKVGVKFG